MIINITSTKVLRHKVFSCLLGGLRRLVLISVMILQLIAFNLLAVNIVKAESEGIYAYLDILAYTDFLSIDLHDEHASGEYFFSNATAGIGYHFDINKNSFGLGVFSRFYAVSEFSKDASEVFNTALNEQNLDYGRTYKIDLDFSTFIIKGVEVFFERRATERFTYSAKLQVFSASELLDGSANGFIFYDGDITSGLQYDVFYESDPILEREVTSENGSGVSLGLAFRYAWSNKLSFGLAVDDAIGKISWPNAPVTVANIDAQSTTLVSKRKLIKKSSILGREFYEDFEKVLPVTYRLQALYDQGPRRWYASAYKNDSFYDMHLGVVNKSTAFNYFFSVSPLHGNIEMGIERKKIRFSLAFEDINLLRSQYFTLSLSRDFDWAFSQFNF